MLGEVQFELQKLVDGYVSSYSYVVICSTTLDILLVLLLQPGIEEFFFLDCSALIY